MFMKQEMKSIFLNEYFYHLYFDCEATTKGRFNKTICYKSNRNKCYTIKSKFQGAACQRVCWNKLRFKIKERQIRSLK